MSGIEDDFVKAVRNAVSVYEQVNQHVATRTREMIQRLGERKALAQLMPTADVQRGFKVLRDSGRLGETFEAIVVRFAQLFEKEVVDAARFRLEHADDL